jgi:D-3-phosphoglycerate dehydrogenase
MQPHQRAHIPFEITQEIRCVLMTIPPQVQEVETVEALILDLLEWIGPAPRPYLEVLEAWRTSCPRLPVWEDATDRGFITRKHVPGTGALVSVSEIGTEHLRKHRNSPPG